MKLTLLIHSLDGGGAEKTFAQMANYWTKAGHDVTLITLDRRESSRYHVSDQVVWRELDLMTTSHSLWEAIRHNRQRVRAIREAIVQADGDIVISFTDIVNVLTLLACRRLKQPVIICERTDPRIHRIGRVWAWLRRRTYKQSAAIVVQTAPIREFLTSMAAGVPIHVVRNCIWPDSLPEETRPLQQRSKQVAAMGRLSYEKGFDLLIEAFSRIANEHPEWSLRIIGDGPLRDALQSQIDQAGLLQRVELVGWSDNPSRILADSQVFVLSSQYEGFPNALLEAMACGTPAISFDCESGPRDIIRHEVDGLLVPAGDVDALADGIFRLIADASDRTRLADRALEVRQRFSIDRFFSDWDDILDSVRERGS
ncbi:MAG: group 1 glycosyl transferase [Planctomycetaceae bacterium]|nr:group 1 glycosyl transferase [Planctomycetaceae bacterium]